MFMRVLLLSCRPAAAAATSCPTLPIGSRARERTRDATMRSLSCAMTDSRSDAPGLGLWRSLRSRLTRARPAYNDDDLEEERGRRMTQALPFDRYPIRIVALANALSLSIYALGGLILARLGWALLAVYLLYLACLEVRQLATGCVHCAYYGRACFSGKGVIASWLFKQGDA